MFPACEQIFLRLNVSHLLKILCIRVLRPNASEKRKFMHCGVKKTSWSTSWSNQSNTHSLCFLWWCCKGWRAVCSVSDVSANRSDLHLCPALLWHFSIISALRINLVTCWVFIRLQLFSLPRRITPVHTNMCEQLVRSHRMTVGPTTRRSDANYIQR